MTETVGNDSYDFVVVGGGTAGCVMARRLSDRPDVRVLLLEAGPPPRDFWIKTPAGMAKMYRSERYNWRFESEPIPSMNNRRLYLPRGKTLGGSSAINGMVHCRGNRGDFDHWAQLGNGGWSWDDVLPYFIRSENNSRGAGPYHGGDGPLAVSDPVVRHPSVVDFIAAASRMGLPHVEDFTGLEHEGAGVLQSNIRNGQRHSAYEAYLTPVRNRPNLTIRTGVLVRRIVLDNRRATGVEVVDEGTVRTYAARREVILSAGAFSSPHVLMLSGIGAGAALQAHGIATQADLPGVGQNLQDHCSIRFLARATPESSYNHALSGWRKYMEGAKYLSTRKGYLALSSSQAAAFVKSRPDLEYADLEISFRPMTFTYQQTGTVEIDKEPAVGASVYRVRPSSRGEVLLRSADPTMPPALVPNFLKDPEDVEASLAGLRILRRILATEPMKKRVVAELMPGPAAQDDEQLIEYMRREGHCSFHPAGTCRMGSDPMAVVDSRLRVHGVAGLRVVDASVMPTVTSGNTNAPTVMIAEKASDMTLADMRR